MASQGRLFGDCPPHQRAVTAAARSTVAHVFVRDLDRPEPDDDDWHHLRVLRLRPGEPVTAGDGVGRWRLCRVGARSRLEPDGEVFIEPPPSPAVAVGFAPVKGDRPEWAVQKLTEIGVDVIVPFVADRSVVRWRGERADGHVARLRRVAREAAMQCRRVWLPEVAELTDFAAALARFPAGQAALAEPGGPALSAETVAVLIGPEGGWSAAELAAAPRLAGLGSTVLRTETAALAAAVLLCALRERRIAPRDGRST